MIRKGFKLTKAGEIPIEWNTLPLSELFYFGNGYTPSKADSAFWTNGTIPWFRVEDIRINGHVLNDAIQKITPLAVKGELFPKNSFIISTSATIGEYAYVTVPYLANQRFVCLIKKSAANQLVDDGYFLCLCESLGQWCRDNCDQGSSFPSVNMQSFRNHHIPLPPLVEQKKIAKALSDVDVLISDLDALIAKKRDIKQGAMQQLLTGKTRLGEYSESWKCKKIGEIGVTYSGLTGKTKEDFGGGNAKYVTFLNVLNNPILNPSMFEEVVIKDGEHQNTCHKGDLFFNTSSETPEEVGVCSMLDEEVESLYLNSFCFGFRLTDPNIAPKYLAYYFRSNEGRKLMTVLAQGVTRYNLSKSTFNNAQIMMPPSLAEQEEIAEFFESIDREIAAIELKKAKYESIKQGMKQELLTGKIRLV